MRLLLFAAMAIAFTLFPGQGLHAQSGVLVRVANGTTLDLLSIADRRAFEYYLPNEMPGTTARLAYVPGAVRAVQALIADEADIAIATLPSGLAAVERGQDLVAFSLASGARPYLHMVASNEIKNWSDLEGQVVAVIGPVDATHYLAEMEMRAAGAEPGKALWRAVGGGAGRATALAAGAAKATMLQSVQALEMMAQGPYHLLEPAGGRRPNFIFKAYWAKRSFLNAHPGLGEAIVRAHLGSVREALDKPRFLVHATVALKPTTDERVASAYDLVRGLGVWDPDGDLLTRESGEATVDEMVRHKVLKQPIGFHRWATTEYVRKAVATLGMRR